MKLQESMKEMIDNSLGIVVLTKRLNHCALLAHRSKKHYYTNAGIYFNSLYTKVMPVELHAVQFKSQCEESILEFDQAYEKLGCSAMRLATDLIVFKLEEAGKIRRLAG